jgi:hypothetical protein
VFAAAVGAGKHASEPKSDPAPVRCISTSHGRTDARQQLEDSERGDDVSRILDPMQNAEHVLDVRHHEELLATVFDEWDAPPCERSLKLVAMVPVRNSTACPFRSMPASGYSRSLCCSAACESPPDEPVVSNLSR